RLQKTVRLLERKPHRERQLQHLVARRAALAHEYLIAERVVEARPTHRLGALEALLLEQLLQIPRQRALLKPVALGERARIRGRKQLLQQLFGQRLFHAALPSLSLLVWFHGSKGQRGRAIRPPPR